MISLLKLCKVVRCIIYYNIVNYCSCSNIITAGTDWNIPKAFILTFKIEVWGVPNVEANVHLVRESHTASLLQLWCTITRPENKSLPTFGLATDGPRHGPPPSQQGYQGMDYQPGPEPFDPYGRHDRCPPGPPSHQVCLLMIAVNVKESICKLYGVQCAKLCQIVLPGPWIWWPARPLWWATSWPLWPRSWLPGGAQSCHAPAGLRAHGVWTQPGENELPEVVQLALPVWQCD